MTGSFGPTIEAANEKLLVDGDRDAAEKFFTPEYVAHVTDGDLKGGPDSVRSFVDMLHGAFSDLEVSVEILAESDDRVAWQRTVTGTQSGSFRGFPATGRRIVWRDMLVSRFHEGRIAEEWAVSDLAEKLLVARRG